jgi:competence protein ComEC
MFKTIFSGALLNFWLFIVFAIGIVIGNFLPFFFLFFALFVLFLSLVYFFYKKNKFFLSDISILLVFLSLGALWQLPYSGQKIEKFLKGENRYILKVTSLPQNQVLRNAFFAELEKANNIPMKGRVKVIDYTKSMDYLKRYEVKAKLTKRQYGKSAFYFLWVKSGFELKELPINVLGKFTKQVTHTLLSIFKSNLDDTSYRFLASVFLGRRELLTRTENEIFKNAGIAHLLAISGSNIGLAAVFLFFILRLFYVRFRVSLLISLVFLFIYTFITGANPPTLRATIMYSVFALSYFVKRKVNSFNSLGLAGLVCLFINPSWVFDVGFQLSFLSIFALIAGFSIFSIKASRILIINSVQYLFFSSFYVTLLITPLISYYFGRVYILSVFYNIILIPFFTFILMINFLLIIFSHLTFISQAIGTLLAALIPIFYNLSQVLGSFKFSFIMYTFSIRLVFIYYFLLGAVFIFIFWLSNQRKPV